MIPARFQERIRRAATDAEVILAAEECLASLAPPEIALLPERCRPRRLLCALDVSTYAFDLVSHHGEETNETMRLVNALAIVFTEASMRLSEILVDSHDDAWIHRRSA
ncbi:MAG TPA: hypothetical protein VHQ02_11365 [Usitatibacter sp.]|nr:hypothetical protein [Usitatibacter sp.]